MKKSTPRPSPGFPQWLHDQLTQRGYELNSPRGGGKSRFAADSGISPATVGRLLKGDRVTDFAVLELLSTALRIPLGEILVRAGMLDRSELRAVRSPAPSPRITPDQALDELGITDPAARTALLATIRAFQRPPHPTPSEGDSLAE
ncbi:helix-turn-helix domain-containing protein [Streptomyces sp. NPDC056500]|uniref:helix-turn-helix domain-containing protein n=1 Tax=Streptomyces sp. NPDC056500 TaxID=3345840 RepID=UPI0036CEEF6A